MMQLPKIFRFKTMLFLTVLFLLFEQGSTDAKRSQLSKNYCRNHIFSPKCRGQQKREAFEDYRFPDLEKYGDNEQLRKASFNPNFVVDFYLRKMAESSDVDDVYAAK